MEELRDCSGHARSLPLTLVRGRLRARACSSLVRRAPNVPEPPSMTSTSLDEVLSIRWRALELDEALGWPHAGGRRRAEVEGLGAAQKADVEATGCAIAMCVVAWSAVCSAVCTRSRLLGAGCTRGGERTNLLTTTPAGTSTSSVPLLDSSLRSPSRPCVLSPSGASQACGTGSGWGPSLRQ